MWEIEKKKGKICNSEIKPIAKIRNTYKSRCLYEVKRRRKKKKKKKSLWVALGKKSPFNWYSCCAIRVIHCWFLWQSGKIPKPTWLDISFFSPRLWLCCNWDLQHSTYNLISIGYMSSSEIEQIHHECQLYENTLVYERGKFGGINGRRKNVKKKAKIWWKRRKLGKRQIAKEKSEKRKLQKCILYKIP